MTFHVKRQMITPRKLSTTNVTLERLGTRVLPVVPRQLVRPRKPPAATFPRTLIRFLAGVRPLVGLEV